MEKKISAKYLGNQTCMFTVWAPFAEDLTLLLENEEEPVKMRRDEMGYWEKTVQGVKPGSLYKYRLDGETFPDPASKSQPKGVHSWSEVIDHDFKWTDSSWKGIPLSKMLIYELHVGTFTSKGTFEGVEEKLDYLQDLGITCIEIMPVAQFPGNRNWGYDGVYPFAAQESYGGAKALKKLVNACHEKEIAVILDVVYNHMGPEGNYLAAYGPYFTDKYHTPWGKAINFDDEYSDDVRNFFLQNAMMWLDEFHFDGLRLDAVHEIIDRGARHFLKEMREKADVLEKKNNKNYILIAESDLNDRRMIDRYEKGGYALDAQWVDDFHHSLHTLLTEEKSGYYKDYGRLEHLAKAFKQAFIYDGKYSKFRKKTVGNNPVGIPPERFVICIQNHDQVGNRMLGERLSHLISFEALKLAAGIMLTAPHVPMLFMGEEFAEDQFFQYFVSHGDKDLVKAVQEGRKDEFKYFFHEKGDFPDPQGGETFNRSKLHWDIKENKTKRSMFAYYKHLIQLRKNGAFDIFRNGDLKADPDEKKGLLSLFARDEGEALCALFNFNEDTQKYSLPSRAENWQLLLDSSEEKWNGNREVSLDPKTQKTIDIAPTSAIIFKGEIK